MSRCPKCNKRLSDSAKFCSSCGETITRNEEGNSRKSHKVIIVLLSALLIVAIVLVSLFAFQNWKLKNDLQSHDKLIASLEESTSKPIVEFAYEDYDKDGTYEAYAITSESTTADEESYYPESDVWYVNVDGAQLIKENVYSKSNGTIKTEQCIYISLEIKLDINQSGASYIYTVVENENTETEISGEYHDVHQQGTVVLGKENPESDFEELEFAGVSDVFAETEPQSEEKTHSKEDEKEEPYTQEKTTGKWKPVITQKPTTTKKQVISNHTHRFSKATCTSPATCSCGKTSGASLGHSFSQATCTSPKACNRCGITSGTSLGHKFSSATCTSAKKCSRCGKTSGSALGHYYVNNKCSRCGKTDPDSLPVGLNKLHVIDCKSDYVSRYAYKNETVKDSFGNTYDEYYYFPAWPNMYAIYNLNYEYTMLKLEIVALDSMDSNAVATIEIYVDGVLKFSKDGFTRTTGKIPVKINVKNAEKLEIRVKQTSKAGDPNARVAIVNTQLTK